jgi:hypothetical protein
MTPFGPPETVHIELDWYDGPRAGIGDIYGRRHRFQSLFDETTDAYIDTFVAYPIAEAEFALELQLWHIFVDWNFRFESGATDVDSHPAHGGINTRWDEISARLCDARAQVPSGALRAVAQRVGLHRGVRFNNAGPDYALAWRML